MGIISVGQGIFYLNLFHFYLRLYCFHKTRWHWHWQGKSYLAYFFNTKRKVKFYIGLSFIHQSSGPKQTSNQNLSGSEKVARCLISSEKLVKHNWKEVLRTHPDPQTLTAWIKQGRVDGQSPFHRLKKVVAICKILILCSEEQRIYIKGEFDLSISYKGLWVWVYC